MTTDPRVIELLNNQRRVLLSFVAPLRELEEYMISHGIMGEEKRTHIETAKEREKEKQSKFE